MADDAKTFMIEHAPIIFRNFAGREAGPYNSEGDRNFCVVLDPVVAEQMAVDGWNVKTLKPREGDGEDDTPIPYIQVRVNFDRRPPRVVMITSTGRVVLNENTIDVLDGVEIKQADLICRGYDWEVGGKSGTKAYLQSLFITIEEDALERKYGMVATEGEQSG